MSLDTLSLEMGGLSEVKVENFEELLIEAEVALTNYRLSDQNRQLISNTLERIKETTDYGVTPDMVNEIDATIRDMALYTVQSNGDVTPVVIDGTETFSYTLTPAQWKQSRIEGCEALLADLSKNITRWAKQLKEKTQELWSNFRYNIDVLNSGLKAIDGRLAEIEDKQPTVSEVLIPKRLSKILSSNNKSGIDAPRADERIRNDVLYILTIIKVWQLESTEFKNRLIRYFGNPEKQKYSFLTRKHPSFFAKKIARDEDNKEIFYWTPPTLLIGYAQITFSENTHKVESLKELSDTLLTTGYGIASFEKTLTYEHNDVTMPSLSTAKLDKLYQIVSKVIAILETLSGTNNSFVLSENDVKDIVATLNGGTADYNEYAETFTSIALHYQENTFETQTGLFRHLFNVANSLIEFMSLHIEAYNGE